MQWVFPVRLRVVAIGPDGNGAEADVFVAVVHSCVALAVIMQFDHFFEKISCTRRAQRIATVGGSCRQTRRRPFRDP